MYSMENVKAYVLDELSKRRDKTMLTTRFMFLKSEMPRAFPSHLFDQAVVELERDGFIALNRSPLGATLLRRE